MRIHFNLLAIVCVVLVLASCGSNDNDNNDSNDDENIWVDDISGLMWQNPLSDDWMTLEGGMTWEESKAYCADLVLDDYDGWRLPTISELRSLIRGCETGISDVDDEFGACGVTDECLNSECRDAPCDGCETLLDDNYSGEGYWPNELTGDVDWYWSSSLVADSGGHDAWAVDFFSALIGIDRYVNFPQSARCVRR